MPGDQDPEIPTTLRGGWPAAPVFGELRTSRKKNFRIWAIREEDSQRAVMNPTAEFAHLQISIVDGHREAFKGFCLSWPFTFSATRASVTR